MPEKYIISRLQNNTYQYKLTAKNGQIILLAQGYKSIEDCESVIGLVRMNVQIDGLIDRKIAKNKLFYFEIKTGNGKIIGTSGIYSSIFTRESGIQAVRKYAQLAPIIVETVAIV
ncbi:MAG: DUF1508 domain-containing protein [Flavobacterium sp.]|nr:MAG: DUF1508 domain-containing protein [Flavobacterium sp.]